jgi:hypothetical protein
LKGRSDTSTERWCGRVIEFGRTSVAKRSQPPKNQESQLVENTALKVNVAEDGDQAGMGHITTLDISFLSPKTRD